MLTLLFIITLCITGFASFYVNKTYRKYDSVKVKSNTTNREFVENLKKKYDMDLAINKIDGYLTDYYNPTNKSINLSGNHSTTVSAIAVAAHETGHALQDESGYIFLKLRTFLVPILNFISSLGYIAIIFGLFFTHKSVVTIGFWIEIALFIFSLVTLPVEFNASKRAISEIDDAQIMTAGELNGARKVLKAAAFTYVVSSLAIVSNIVRLNMYRDNN